MKRVAYEVVLFVDTDRDEDALFDELESRLNAASAGSWSRAEVMLPEPEES